MRNAKRIIFRILLLVVVAFTLLSLFYLADLRTSDIKRNTQSSQEIRKAQDLLAAAIEKQGLDRITQFKTYEAIGTDHWQGAMGKMGNPWRWNNDQMALRFTVGDFDSQVEVLEGEQTGFVAGI
ncbi:MAG: hypothetical protein AAF391_03505, partial [Bacteroidota bacterium]